MKNNTFNKQPSIVQQNKVGVTGTSNNMLSQNNQYFYQGNQPNKKNFNQYGAGNAGVAATLLDDANEDEFWY